jgi:hypothetical protein
VDETEWKGQSVRRKAVIVIGILLLGGTAVLVAGATSRGAPRWEYGTYIERTDNYHWQQPGQHVEAETLKTFLRRMGLPTTVEVDPRTDTTANTLLNHLGAQGWELITSTADPDGHTYWLKRPR